MERKSFEEGIILALVSPPIPHVVKKPISYSYNGVILPALPEWDREAYPYAWMTTDHNLYIADKPYMRCTGDNGKDCFAINGNMESGEIVNSVVYEMSADGTSFVLDNRFNNVDALWIFMVTAPLWTNFDVINADDNSVFFSASEPIPIYA